MRIRTWHFFVSGALGGLAGYLVMETYSTIMSSSGIEHSTLMRMALYFSGFGLAVGAALGMTEGLVCRQRGKLWYGLIVGLLLGGLGGFAGGWVGQAIFGLVPLRYATRAHVDIAIALDSSSSMRSFLVLGSDPFGHRKKAAQRLIERLSSIERVSVIDFDTAAKVLCPLTALSETGTREKLTTAISEVDSSGGTSLDAGLLAAIDTLEPQQRPGRSQHIIFLTDGMGDYTPTTAARAIGSDIIIHTIGLGSEVDARLLQGIAASTGGRYIPVADAGDLSMVFTTIFEEEIAVTESRSEATGSQHTDQEVELLTSPLLIRIARVLGWAAVGLAIGLGQGVRENTREDLRACSIGGLIGGVLGGAAFDPAVSAIAPGSGLAGRAVGDLIVGACIGGSMRVAQRAMVELRKTPTTPLISFLPEKEGTKNIKSREAGKAAPGSARGTASRPRYQASPGLGQPGRAGSGREADPPPIQRVGR